MRMCWVIDGAGEGMGGDGGNFIEELRKEGRTLVESRKYQSYY